MRGIFNCWLCQLMFDAYHRSCQWTEILSMGNSYCEVQLRDFTRSRTRHRDQRLARDDREIVEEAVQQGRPSL